MTCQQRQVAEKAARTVHPDEPGSTVCLLHNRRCTVEKDEEVAVPVPLAEQGSTLGQCLPLAEPAEQHQLLVGEPGVGTSHVRRLRLLGCQEIRRTARGHSTISSSLPAPET